MKNRPRKLRPTRQRPPHGEGAAHPATGEQPPPDRWRWWVKWALALLVIALAAGATFALFEFVLPSRLPSEIVGRWRVVGGRMDGASMEFSRNGSMTSRLRTGDKEFVMDGTATVSGKTLRTTTVNPLTGAAATGTQTIVTLTADELVVEDRTGTRTTMRRIR
jgi:uncharacterized protein (TIGR03066 family)